MPAGDRRAGVPALLGRGIRPAASSARGGDGQARSGSSIGGDRPPHGQRAAMGHRLAGKRRGLRRLPAPREIGRAAGRGRGEISGGAVSFKKKKTNTAATETMLRLRILPSLGGSAES